MLANVSSGRASGSTRTYALTSALAWLLLPNPAGPFGLQSHWSMHQRCPFSIMPHALGQHHRDNSAKALLFHASPLTSWVGKQWQSVLVQPGNYTTTEAEMGLSRSSARMRFELKSPRQMFFLRALQLLHNSWP